MKKRRLSILLSIVMLFSLLPTTALAADNHPDASNVFVDGDKNFYNSTRLYFKNNDPKDNFTGTSTEYNAAYDPTTGTLTLKNYSGKGILVGGVGRTDITVVLIGTNTINDGSITSDMGGDITITSDSSGTLTITNILNDSNAAIGIQAGYGPQTTGNVTITGDANVTIDMTHNGTRTCEKAYGIFARENITISGDASVAITCATPKNTTGGDYCNGLYAAQNVTIDTNGTIEIDVKNAGKDANNGYSFGVYPMGTATLTKVGNMEVQWKKVANHSGYPGGAIKGGGSITNPHAVNVDTTNCYASYRFGTPRKVTAQNGQLTGPGVPNASGSGMFLVNDTVNITPYERKSNSGEVIPFKEWTAEGVTLTSSTTADTSFSVPANAVTVTATYKPFDGAPVFARTDDSRGTIAFQTAVKPDGGSEYFEYVKVGKENDPYEYRSIAPQPTTASTASSYEYSVSASNYYTGGDIKNLKAGDYRMAVTLSGKRYLSDPFTVDYTAAPTGNYPDHVRVYNASGAITSLGDKQYLAANSDTAVKDNFDGTQTYVARYDQSSGTLYLNGYHGAATHNMIFSIGDLNIEVERDSSFTTSTTATGNLYGIRADGGKLNISGSGKLTVTANGRGNVYGISAKEGVTISAPLAVTVGKNSTTENGPVYGIHAQGGTISLSGNDMTVTATGGTENAYGVYNEAQTSLSAADNGNIDISGKLTVNLSNGKNNRGISSQGGVITLDGATVKIPGNYYYGIFNENGNVVIKSNSNMDISSNFLSNRGICTYTSGNLIIENSTVNIRAKGYAAELKGNVSIKNSTVDLTLDAETYCVVDTNNNAENTIDLSGTGTVTLTASGNQTFAMIGGNVTLGANTKCEKGTASGGSYYGAHDADSNKTVLKFMSTAPTATVDDVTIGGTTGTTIFNEDVVITLTNDKFYSIAADTVVSSWFTNLPTGLNAKIKTAVNDNDTTATIEISGTPSAISSAALAITIPAASLASNANLTVTINENAKYNITAPLTAIAVPTANSVTYDGTEKTGVSDGTGYTLGGTYKATDVGATDYTATATLNTGYKWNDGTTDATKTITWNIGKRTPTAADFTFAPPTNLTYDGNDKTASVTLNSTFTNSGAITVKYEKDSASVTKTKDVGEYTVKIDVAVGDNFDAISDLTASAWKFSITPAEWGTPTETLTPVNPTTTGGNDGQITGTTSAMQYKKSTDSNWADCSGAVTGLAAGTYYVRYKADSNHTASDTNYQTVTLTDPGTTLYSVTVTDGTAVPTGDQAAGTEVTITANTKTGFNFKEWTGLADGIYKTGFTKTSNPATFIMPASNVSVKATFTKTSGGGSSSGGGGGGYVPTTQKPEIKAAAGGKAELSKDGTTLTITADAGKVIDKVLLNGKDMGAVSELKGLKTGDKVEVIFKDQVTEPTKEELDKAAKEAAGELVLPARSAKLKNGSVKVVVKGDLKGITDAGYTVKYKFYRSTKKSAGYKAMKTGKSGIYINTYGKKGTMYYYKARVMIYDKDGNFVAQTALKQCKYASRLWTK